MIKKIDRLELDHLLSGRKEGGKEAKPTDVAAKKTPTYRAK